MKIITGTFLVALATIQPALASNFPGKIIAEYYNDEMSIPNGWELTYIGRQSNIEVFQMSRDLDEYPKTAILNPFNQIKNLFCSDESLKELIDSGLMVRADIRDNKNGNSSVSTGKVLENCD